MSPTAWISTTRPARRGRHRGPIILSDRSIAQAYRVAFNMRYGRAARNGDADILRWHYRHDSLDPEERMDGVVHRMNKEENADFTVRAGRKAVQSGSACAG